jgi:hypothetical protein
VPRPRLRTAALLCGALIAALLAGGARAALVEIGDLVLHADGGFTPRTLPRRAYAPIEFRGHFDVGSKSGPRPVALQQVVVSFDRDGHLDPLGLPTCSAEAVANLGVAEARALCRGAIVGSGHIEAVIVAGGQTFHAASPLTLFNAPPVEGNPALVLHARTTTPAVQVLAITIPIQRRAGRFRYRAVVDLPAILGGNGSITHVDLSIGRRFRFGGRRRSYVSARCTDGILETRGRFSFADGTVIEGGVEKFCRPILPRPGR